MPPHMTFVRSANLSLDRDQDQLGIDRGRHAVEAAF
jgi:hypothetical protein